MASSRVIAASPWLHLLLSHATGTRKNFFYSPSRSGQRSRKRASSVNLSWTRFLAQASEELSAQGIWTGIQARPTPKRLRCRWILGCRPVEFYRGLVNASGVTRRGGDRRADEEQRSADFARKERGSP